MWKLKQPNTYFIFSSLHFLRVRFFQHVDIKDSSNTKKKIVEKKNLDFNILLFGSK